MTDELQRPRPVVDADSAPFWDGLSDGRLLIPRCLRCGHVFFPSMPACPVCGAAEIGQIEASGLGHLYSWVTVHIALDPAFAADVPYTIVSVDLVEGGRVLGRLLGAVPDGLRGGESMRFDPYRDGEVALPGFRLARPAGL